MSKEKRREGEPKSSPKLTLPWASECRIIGLVLQYPNYEHGVDQEGTCDYPRFPGESLQEHPCLVRFFRRYLYYHQSRLSIWHCEFHFFWTGGKYCHIPNHSIIGLPCIWFTRDMHKISIRNKWLKQIQSMIHEFWELIFSTMFTAVSWGWSQNLIYQKSLLSSPLQNLIYQKSLLSSPLQNLIYQKSLLSSSLEGMKIEKFQGFEKPN